MKKNRAKLIMGGIMALATLPWFIGQANAGPGWGDSTDSAGNPIKVPTYYANSPAGMRPDPLGGAGIDTGTAMRKFIDGLPGIPGVTTYDDPVRYPNYYTDNSSTNPLLGVTNNLGQEIPLAIPDTTTYPGCNYYQIGIVEFHTKMHTDLVTTDPDHDGTVVRGYVQLETADNAAVSKHVALTYPDGTAITYPPDFYDSALAGQPILAVDYPNYLGPIIVTTTGTPVRITYANLLPTGHYNDVSGQRFGDLFLPVDRTLMGAGIIPGTASELYTENRTSIHFHGGDTPWISDGTPNQYTVPYGETTTSKVGDSFALVPDMEDPGDGWGTLYYQNDLSGRLMFYHDHAVAITRLNVYAGMVAGYLINDAPGLGENRLIAANTPGNTVLPEEQIPLIIQEKTFVPLDVSNVVSTSDGTTKVGQDEKWDTAHWGQPGDQWYANVYEYNQDPDSFDGTNPVGRWDFGPLFWPIFPASGTIPTGEYGNACTTPEAFGDTPVINGTAYPVLNVDPKAYRFRILNGSNDRYFSLGLYVAAHKGFPTTPGTTGALLCDGTVALPATGCTEVKMVNFDTSGTFPAYWGVPDNREGGVPDPNTAGPDLLQIGNEGGLLAALNDIPSTPTNYEYNKRSVTVLNVMEHGLWLGPAERADVVVDFSKFAGQTLILYNDAPAPLPAGDPRLDYYTGDSDQSGSGGWYPTLPGYGPNTRTMMQINVAGDPATTYPALDQATLESMLPIAYADVQPKSVVAEPAYDNAFGTSDSGGVNQYAKIFAGSINQPALIFKTGSEVSYFPFKDGTGANPELATSMVTVAEGDIATIPVQNKAIQELFDPYGRMNATLGVELPFTGSNVQTTVPLGYIDPITEVISDGETQIWKITHNGVDTHPVHFHLVNVQLLNRVGWDGTIKPPDPSEIGWKETVKMNPLEDVIVAVRANAPKVPFGVPDSVRPLSPSDPIGSTANFSNLDPLTGNPYAVPVTNEVTNLGWEYVWHCHILGHEENDFMRTIVFRFTSDRPAIVGGVSTNVIGPNQIDVSWIDPTPIASSYGDHSNEIGFLVQRSDNNGVFHTVGIALANSEIYSDTSVASGTPPYRYRVVAYNQAGNSPTADDRIGTFNNGNWLLDTNLVPGWQSSDTSASLGTTGDIAVVGDWDGDGAKEIGVFSNGVWHLDTNGVPGLQDTDTTVIFGITGDVPVVGDWTGAGHTSIGVFRNGRWYLDSNGIPGYQAGDDTSVNFGKAGGIPVVGDWDGDVNRTTNIGVFRNGQWLLDSNGTPGLQADDINVNFGKVGDTPVVGDWTGAGHTSIGVVRNSSVWYLDTNVTAGWQVGDTTLHFGISGDIPVVGDWTSVGHTSIGVFRNGRWYLDTNGTNGWQADDTTVVLGATGDTPVVGNW